MTAEEVIRKVRLSFIDDWRQDTILAELPRERRREFIAASRSIRARRRALIKSEAFRSLARGYTSVPEPERDLQGLIAWLSILRSFGNADGLRPQELVARTEEQRSLRLGHVSRLREIAATVTEKYATKLTELANDIEADGLALRQTEIGLHMIGDPSNLGRSGAAAVRPPGAWRGWFIRELHARLPNLDRIPQPYATMAALLTWAGIKDVTPMLVRSILKRGAT